MSNRGDEGYRGSSRYHKEDNRNYDGRSRRDRSRSRERTRYRSRSGDRRDERRRDYKTDTKVKEMSISPRRGRKSSSSRSPSPPPPPMISKVSLEFKSSSSKPLKVTLNPPPAQIKPPIIKKTVASVFNDNSDDEPEEMPPEARMRMRNIGRDTPTSAGPNSYGKTKHGFCDQKAITQKSLKAAMDQVNAPPSSAKLPATIYRLSQQ